MYFASDYGAYFRTNVPRSSVTERCPRDEMVFGVRKRALYQPAALCSSGDASQASYATGRFFEGRIGNESDTMLLNFGWKGYKREQRRRS
ncbi:unnamed protein product [Somion occarium]|uniref:Uncharacterized protein n=1 Tax=Somion occarium TaxID=3059160 RepID=A0ABP1CG64_9APHY